MDIKEENYNKDVGVLSQIYLLLLVSMCPHVAAHDIPAVSLEGQISAWDSGTYY